MCSSLQIYPESGNWSGWIAASLYSPPPEEFQEFARWWFRIGKLQITEQKLLTIYYLLIQA